MENAGVVDPRISADDVISKLKDDGDFDRLRLRIVRKLKDNEELRNSIISVVNQSAALSRPGAENMKPRQLSDAIHNEVGEKVMSQISDGIWDIIRSGDDMKSEITETVKSVYSKLLNPKGNEDGQPSSPSDTITACKGPDNNGPVTSSAGEINDSLAPNEPKEPPVFDNSDIHQNKISNALDDSEPKEPPGFPHSDVHQSKINETLADNDPDEPPGFAHSNIQQNNHEEQRKAELPLPMPSDGLPIEAQKEGPHPSQDAALEPDDEDLSAPPGFSATGDHKQPCDGSDEDPDMPPGFGG